MIAVYKTLARALFDSGALPNVMSENLCNLLHHQLFNLNRRMRITDGTEAVKLGKFTTKVVTVGGLIYEMTFLVVTKAPLDLIIGRPAIKEMKATLEFDKDIAIAIFKEGGKPVKLPHWTEGEERNDTLSEKFTSDDKGYDEDESVNDDSEDRDDVDECNYIG